MTDKATNSGREPTGTSFLRAVQQLGHSCGQSVMAADLAAFVTHKQLLGGVVAVDATLNHSRPPSMSTIPGTQCMHPPGDSRCAHPQDSSAVQADTRSGHI